MLFVAVTLSSVVRAWLVLVLVLVLPGVFEQILVDTEKGLQPMPQRSRRSRRIANTHRHQNIRTRTTIDPTTPITPPITPTRGT